MQGLTSIQAVPYRALDAFDTFIKLLVRLSELATILIAFFITVAMIVGVFFRFVLNSSIGWTEELSSLLLAVMMFLVIGIGIHERIHISVFVIIERFQETGQKIFDIAIHIVCGLFFLLIAYEGLKVAQSGMAMRLATLPIPRGVFFYAMPIGGAFAALVCLNNIFRVLRGQEQPRLKGID